MSAVLTAGSKRRARRARSVPMAEKPPFRSSSMCPPSRSRAVRPRCTKAAVMRSRASSRSDRVRADCATRPARRPETARAAPPRACSWGSKVRSKAGARPGSPATERSIPEATRHVKLRQRLHGFGDLRAGMLVILQLAGEIGFVSGEVEVAVPAQAEQNGARAIFFARRDGFVEGGPDGVRGFRPGKIPSTRANCTAARRPGSACRPWPR